MIWWSSFAVSGSSLPPHQFINTVFLNFFEESSVIGRTIEWRQGPCLAPCVHAVLSIIAVVRRSVNSDVVQIALHCDPLTPRKSKSVYTWGVLHCLLTRNSTETWKGVKSILKSSVTKPIIFPLGGLKAPQLQYLINLNFYFTVRKEECLINRGWSLRIASLASLSNILMSWWSQLRVTLVSHTISALFSILVVWGCSFWQNGRIDWGMQ